jgi:hypothetical protein
MHAIKSLRWIVGLSMLIGTFSAIPAQAESSYSDITGTNIWNNTAPIFDSKSRIDPDLISNINRVNRDAEAAYNACNAAIDQAAQNAPTTRRYARRPLTATVEVPVACRQLEQLRAEAENLRSRVDEVQRTRSSTAFGTW